MLVVTVALEDGSKKFVVIGDGCQESGQSWTELLLALKAHGFEGVPKLVVGSMEFDAKNGSFDGYKRP